MCEKNQCTQDIGEKGKMSTTTKRLDQFHSNAQNPQFPMDVNDENSESSYHPTPTQISKVDLKKDYVDDNKLKANINVELCDVPDIPAVFEDGFKNLYGSKQSAVKNVTNQHALPISKVRTGRNYDGTRNLTQTESNTSYKLENENGESVFTNIHQDDTELKKRKGNEEKISAVSYKTDGKIPEDTESKEQSVLAKVYNGSFEVQAQKDGSKELTLNVPECVKPVEPGLGNTGPVLTTGRGQDVVDGRKGPTLESGLGLELEDGKNDLVLAAGFNSIKKLDDRNSAKSGKNTGQDHRDGNSFPDSEVAYGIYRDQELEDGGYDIDIVSGNGRGKRYVDDPRLESGSGGINGGYKLNLLSVSGKGKEQEDGGYNLGLGYGRSCRGRELEGVSYDPELASNKYKGHHDVSELYFSSGRSQEYESRNYDQESAPGSGGSQEWGKESYNSKLASVSVKGHEAGEEKKEQIVVKLEKNEWVEELTNGSKSMVSGKACSGESYTIRGLGNRNEVRASAEVCKANTGTRNELSDSSPQIVLTEMYRAKRDGQKPKTEVEELISTMYKAECVEDKRTKKRKNRSNINRRDCDKKGECQTRKFRCQELRFGIESKPESAERHKLKHGRLFEKLNIMCKANIIAKNMSFTKTKSDQQKRNSTNLFASRQLYENQQLLQRSDGVTNTNETHQQEIQLVPPTYIDQQNNLASSTFASPDTDYRRMNVSAELSRGNIPNLDIFKTFEDELLCTPVYSNNSNEVHAKTNEILKEMRLKTLEEKEKNSKTCPEATKCLTEKTPETVSDAFIVQTPISRKTKHQRKRKGLNQNTVTRRKAKDMPVKTKKQNRSSFLTANGGNGDKIPNSYFQGNEKQTTSQKEFKTSEKTILYGVDCLGGFTVLKSEPFDTDADRNDTFDNSSSASHSSRGPSRFTDMQEQHNTNDSTADNPHKAENTPRQRSTQLHYNTNDSTIDELTTDQLGKHDVQNIDDPEATLVYGFDGLGGKVVDKTEQEKLHSRPGAKYNFKGLIKSEVNSDQKYNVIDIEELGLTAGTEINSTDDTFLDSFIIQNVDDPEATLLYGYDGPGGKIV